MSYSDFCELCAVCGDVQLDELTLWFAMEAQDVPMTEVGNLTRDAFYKLFAINIQYDPAKVHSDLRDKLGMTAVLKNIWHSERHV